jgi:hypothetical protein
VLGTSGSAPSNLVPGDTTAGRLRNYTAEDGLTSKDIFGIYTDCHGDLWLTGNGVFKFNGTSFDRIH